jgi:hypothetical protein
MSNSAQEIENLISQEYKQGFVTELEVDTFPPGLDEDVIRRLSKVKNEPEFMLEYRLKAFRHWQTMPSPDWALLNIEPRTTQTFQMSCRTSCPCCWDFSLPRFNGWFTVGYLDSFIGLAIDRLCDLFWLWH